MAFVLVAAVTEMKLQRKYICAEQCQAFPLPFVKALALFFVWCKAAQISDPVQN